MIERWKYQIKTGWPFGVIMPVVITLFDWFGSTFSLIDAFFSKRFLIELVIFLFVGIFAIGYSNWRERAKNEMYNKN